MTRRRHSGNRGARRVRLGGGSQSTSTRCQKLRYTSEEAAGTAALLRGEVDGKYPDALRVYYCPKCRGFHLTSQPKRTDPAF